MLDLGSSSAPANKSGECEALGSSNFWLQKQPKIKPLVKRQLLAALRKGLWIQNITRDQMRITLKCHRPLLF